VQLLEFVALGLTATTIVKPIRNGLTSRSALSAAMPQALRNDAPAPLRSKRSYAAGFTQFAMDERPVTQFAITCCNGDLDPYILLTTTNIQKSEDRILVTILNLVTSFS
jgi:hypothetical protein